ncbi:hypothetical protein BCV69DRAFT_301945 [Microstroma glucosiphilum]|uniref:Uncharacterized protein n=1 Tax=Pseudomicrostroma glucosiphilum TaxID=1684307 RepID=A0A316TXW4_9BASI|nr:hypothetical protein BCV69DRAFT_301945 [Pseudomicrostroma glucosiphilum]PWN17668.1 hypothetical protein BCV69DRAFT_301945 [Pseudomicrostroma glucosiphilum]
MKRHFSIFFGKEAGSASISPPLDEASDSAPPDFRQRHSFHSSPPRLPASDQLSPLKVSLERADLPRRTDGSVAQNRPKKEDKGILKIPAKTKQDTLMPGMRQTVRSASAGPMTFIKQQKASEPCRPRLPNQEVQAFNAELLRAAAARSTIWHSPRKVREEARARAQQSSSQAHNGTVRTGRGPTAAGPGCGIHASGRQFSATSLADRLGLARESEKKDGGA